MNSWLSVAIFGISILFAQALAQENTSEGWYKKGTELGNNGSYDEAITAYERSIELNGSYAPAWSAKGALLFQMGKKDEAKLALRMQSNYTMSL